MREHEQASPSNQKDDRWLDEALSQSFPASDPLPIRHGAAPMNEAADTAARSPAAPSKHNKD